jgi:hypothetical protein
MSKREQASEGARKPVAGRFRRSWFQGPEIGFTGRFLFALRSRLSSPSPRHGERIGELLGALAECWAVDSGGRDYVIDLPRGPHAPGQVGGLPDAIDDLVGGMTGQLRSVDAENRCLGAGAPLKSGSSKHRWCRWGGVCLSASGLGAPAGRGSRRDCSRFLLQMQWNITAMMQGLAGCRDSLRE